MAATSAPASAKIDRPTVWIPSRFAIAPSLVTSPPVYPNEPLRMEHGKDSITGRAIDIVSPIGKGQRGLIVSPPKAGKTTILKKICQSISINNPEVHLICLLVDEAPEEVTDMQRSIKGEVVASTLICPPTTTLVWQELVIGAPEAHRGAGWRRRGGARLHHAGSCPRLTTWRRPPRGRILSGGVDSAALYPAQAPRAQPCNIENGGSLTIHGLCAHRPTGSKMDEVIFEGVQGHRQHGWLDRDLADRLIFRPLTPLPPCTRNEDLCWSTSRCARLSLACVAFLPA